MLTRTLSSPLGPLCIVTDGAAVIRLAWSDAGADTSPLLLDAERQLTAYFDGTLTDFDLPLAPQGSPAQRRACAAMAAIPFGETRTYGELANDIGVSAQAMGQLCGGNPIPILVPCHRVLGANGLGGFSGAGGIEDKVWLLRHEGAAGLLI